MKSTLGNEMGSELKAFVEDFIKQEILWFVSIGSKFYCFIIKRRKKLKNKL